MASRQAIQASGSEGDVAIDERKRKRMLSNRESARRSRRKKQQRLDDLINQATQLNDDNSQIVMQLNSIAEKFVSVDSENSGLRTEMMKLAERLESLNSVLRFVQEFSGMAMDIPEIPRPLLKPWQHSCMAALPIATSANMFHRQ